MKLAKKVLQFFEDQAEAGDTSSHEDGHFHKTSIDIDGNGKTIKTIGGEDHEHKIVKNIAKGHGHKHEVIA